MADFYPQIVALLLAAGCRLVRPGKGSHEIWHSPVTNEVLKQAGLPKAF